MRLAALLVEEVSLALAMEHIGELEGLVADGLPRDRTLAVASCSVSW